VNPPTEPFGWLRREIGRACRKRSFGARRWRKPAPASWCFCRRGRQDFYQTLRRQELRAWKKRRRNINVLYRSAKRLVLTWIKLDETSGHNREKPLTHIRKSAFNGFVCLPRRFGKTRHVLPLPVGPLHRQGKRGGILSRLFRFANTTSPDPVAKQPTCWRISLSANRIPLRRDMRWLRLSHQSWCRCVKFVRRNMFRRSEAQPR
jgi:hypothetical protein